MKSNLPPEGASHLTPGRFPNQAKLLPPGKFRFDKVRRTP